MKIRWIENTDLCVIYNYDEEAEVADEGFEIVEKDEVDEVDVLEDKGSTVDMQFGNGWVAFGVQKKWFEIEHSGR
jgi:hypothetical protein